MKTKKILLTAMVAIVFIAGAHAQNVTIPDANFKAALVGNASINSNMDAEIQTSEASVFNGAINVSQLNIADLTGIEAFVALDSLDCSRNQIAGLDVSSNLALTYLDCSYNLGVDAYQNEYFIYYYYMDSLDVSANIALTILKCNNNGLLSINTTGLTGLTYLDCSNNGRLNFSSSPGEAPGYYVISTPIFDFASNVALAYLNCSSNGLSSLDVSENAALTYLDCSNYSSTNGEGDFIGGGTLSSLDFSSNVTLVYLNCSNNFSSSLNVSGNVALTSLYCSSNGLSSLDVSSNLALTYLDCSYNQIDSLDVSANNALTDLNCSFNQLTSLDLNQNTALTDLNCSFNQLTSLDLSQNTALTGLWCPFNELTSLNVKNGNNINMLYFFAVQNPISCVEVDDVQWSIDNWYDDTYSSIPPNASFSLNCSGAGISDINSNAPIFYPNPTTGNIYLSEPANITLTDLSGNLLLEEKNTNQLDISALPAGMYFLSFGENNQHTFKVIKE